MKKFLLFVDGTERVCNGYNTHLANAPYCLSYSIVLFLNIFSISFVSGLLNYLDLSLAQISPR